MRLPRVRLSVLGMMIMVALLSPVCAYIGSYYRLSRRSMDEPYSLPTILYVSHDEFLTRDGRVRHYTRATMYSPLNWLDRTIFGTRPAERGSSHYFINRMRADGSIVKSRLVGVEEIPDPKPGN
jgi:hypothetical protein